ncbi:hypothetical protein HMPREF9412_2142 [Paenibacillus sp. HGF5]|nr:hypothetical protein HMPREF9412_2142 [Paenibacillus sp. HGF5]
MMAHFFEYRGIFNCFKEAVCLLSQQTAGCSDSLYVQECVL